MTVSRSALTDAGLAALPAEKARPAARAGLRRLLDAATLYGAVLLALVPVAYMVFASFGSGLVTAGGGDAWGDVLSDPRILSAAATSLLLSLRVAVAFFLALAISLAVVRLRLPGRRLIEVSLWFAFFLPAVPMAMAWTLLLSPDYGLLNAAFSAIPFLPRPLFSIESIPGIMWIHLTLSTVPFLSLVFTPVVRQMDASYEDVARVHGAGRLATVLRITGPMLFPALLLGALAVFIKTLQAFEVEQIVGVPAGIGIFTTAMYGYVRQDPPMFAHAMALGCLVLLVAVSLAALQAFLNRGGRQVATMRTQSARLGQAAGRRLRLAAAAVIFLYLAVSLYLPLATLVLGSFNKIFGFFAMPRPWTAAHWLEVFGDPRFLRAVRNSTLIGLAAVAIALPLFFRLAWIIARGRVPGRLFAIALLWLPWALPGFVFGLAFLEITLGFRPLNALYGTVVPVLLVLLIKEMPIGVHLLRVAIGQAGRELENAALLAGAGPFTVFRRITLPLLSSTVISVMILVFVSAVSEIGSIVLVAGPGTETVALLMFDYAINGRSEAAAVIGVLYAVVSMLLAVLVSARLLPAGPR